MRCHGREPSATPSLSQASCSGSGRWRDGSASWASTDATPEGMNPPPVVVNPATSICLLRFCLVSTTDRSARAPNVKRLKNLVPW